MYRSLLLITFLLTKIVLIAQPTLEFDKLSMNDGFSSGRANAIIQDQKGYMWVGTWNGLNKYDGYTCKVYIPDYRDSLTLSNREVVALLEDRNGKIWIGTTSGLNCLDPVSEKIISYPFNSRILTLFQDKGGLIWAGTVNGGLTIIDPETRNRRHYFNNETISDICKTSDDVIWLASYAGLIKADRNTLEYTRYQYDDSNTSNSISNNTVTQVEVSNNGELWVGTWGGGLNKVTVNNQNGSINFQNYIPRGIQKNKSAPVIFKMIFDNSGNLWIGTWDNGLILLDAEEQSKDPEQAQYHFYKHNINNPASLSGNNISALFIDRSGILWIGAVEINKCSIVKTGINQIKTVGYDNGEFSYKPIRSFAQQKDKVWVGTSKELLLIEKQSENYRIIKEIEDPSYTFNNVTYTSTSILSIAKNKHGLWVGTDDAGLLFYPDAVALTEKNPAYQFFNTATSPQIQGNKINNIVPSKLNPDVLWLGSQQNGFAKLTYSGGVVSTEIPEQDNRDNSISDNNIRAILEDQDGLVWIGTQNGLNCYNPTTGIFENFYHSFLDTTSINDNVINILYEDSNGYLWIGTNSGLNRKVSYQLPSGKKQVIFKNYGSLSKIGNSIITNIVEDNSGLLWIKPYRGIVQFNPQSERVIKDYLTKEFRNLAIERNAVIKLNNGDILLGGSNSVISFHPDSLFINSTAPEVGITDILIFNESIDSRYPGNVKNKEYISAPYRKDLHLSYRDQEITITFSAMDYKDPERNNYAYFLEGHDEKWNEVGNRNSATYTNIPPGEYTFYIKASSSDGKWSSKAATLNISIAAPWWKTKWALVGYALIFIAILYFFKEYSIIQVREKSRIMLDLFQKEKEQKLNEMKALFFTDITHEFRTPLTLIQGPAEEISKLADGNSQIKKQSQTILKNTNKLLRLVNQLMDFRKVERGKMDVFYQPCNVSDIMKEVFESYYNLAKSRSIDFKLEIPKSALLAYIDIDKIEKTIYNLTSNAFKYSDDESSIILRAKVEKDKKLGEIIQIEIEDDGIGISEDDQKRVFERFYQTHQKTTQSTGGIGLYISQTFIEQHGGYIKLNSELGKGSCFKVVIPTNSDKIKDEQATIIKESEYQSEPETTISQSIEQEDSKSKRKATDRFNVLIVEDNSDLNEFIVSGLSKDYNVTGVFNGKEGFEQARLQTPNIIITDIMMPEMDGFELCRLLRNDLSTSHIPVIFLTAKTLREDEIKGLKLGAVDYIYKPFSLTTLNLKIHNVLNNQKNIHEKIRTEKILEPEKIELSSLDEELLINAVKAVDDHLDDPNFDVDRFSEVIGLSANQAYRKIKALTGQTAKEFIRNQRLKTAASLLLQKKRSISEIIYMVGFSSPSYFSRCFKEFYKCTPKEYIAKDGNID